ncbi:8223_t:CDS:2, partial [Entrophospora sp. SA101]
ASSCTKKQTIKILEQELIDGEKLLYDFVLPYELFEQELELIRLIDKTPSPAVLEKIWRKIMENAVNVAYATGSLEPISIKIIEAGTHELVFNDGYITNLFREINIKYRLKLLLDEIVYLLYKWIDDKVESKDMDIRKMLQLISKYEHAASSYHRIFQQDLSFKFLDIQQKLENIEMKSYLYTS